MELAIVTATIKEILKENGVYNLYHANTVGTAVTFLKVGGLLSRGVVRDRRLFQTYQQSDHTDKQLGVFYDIFFDTVDVHKRSRNICFYGQVMFVYDVDVLDTVNNVKVTKTNPISWKGNLMEEKKYFVDSDDLNKNLAPGNFGQHVTIHDYHNVLPFRPYIRDIILDNPGEKWNSYFDAARERIGRLIQDNNLDIELRIRECPEECRCQEKYNNKYSEYVIRSKFGIKGNAVVTQTHKKWWER